MTNDYSSRNLKAVFMPGRSFVEVRARLAAQPMMIWAKCGECGGDLYADAPADSETAPITYACDYCELAWDSEGRPERYYEGGP
jgi:hypothetical protein